MKKIAIFASGSGTNANVLMDYFHNHAKIRVCTVITNNSNAGVLKFAEKHSIPYCVFENADFVTGEKIWAALQSVGCDFIVLAGFLRKIPELLVERFSQRIINIHPALLPKFGGKGMYGINVHNAVLEAKEKTTGITIHLVNNAYDEGDIIEQYSCDITSLHSAVEIQKAVQDLEHKYYKLTIENYIENV